MATLGVLDTFRQSNPFTGSLFPLSGSRSMVFNTAFWRKWHRWIAFPATLFLLWVSITGMSLAIQEFFGADEALREATRNLVSPATTGSPVAVWSDPVERALAVVNARTHDAPIDKIEFQFKGENPTIAIFTGKPAGGEDKKFVVSAKTGVIQTVEDYADKPFLVRLHSGEAFGDGGLVVAMFWGLALAVLSITGLIIYLRIRRPGATGIRKVFW
jgi:uncharacterized iron-regulated membrane protein